MLITQYSISSIVIAGLCLAGSTRASIGKILTKARRAMSQTRFPRYYFNLVIGVT